MSKKPFYDHDEVLKTYLAHRERVDNPNDVLERPVFMELVGDLSGLDIVDLGCGDGALGREALMELGARSYCGVEVSQSMAALAKDNLADCGGRLLIQSMEDWRTEPDQADLVVSRLALNYIEGVEGVFEEAHNGLRESGRLIFSVEHPVITSNYGHIERGRRESWVVDDYFDSGARRHEWLGRVLTKYHHTLEEWIGFVKNAGFALEDIRESRPQKANFESMEEFKRRSRIPLFLFVSAKKIGR